MKKMIVAGVLISFLGLAAYTLSTQAGQPVGQGPMEHGMMGRQGGMGMMGGIMMGPGMGMMGPGMMGPMMSPELMGTIMAVHGEVMSMMRQMMQKYGSQMEQMTPQLHPKMARGRPQPHRSIAPAAKGSKDNDP